jgi:hypothetical protein
MSVIPMYNHYDECGEPCARVSINVMGQAVSPKPYYIGVIQGLYRGYIGVI